MMGLKSLIRKSSRLSKFASVVSLYRHQVSYLNAEGWVESINAKSSIDKVGDPIPWITYPALHFLKPRLKKQFHLFEFGSGNSTLFWSGLVNTVVSCEHDKSWFNLLLPNMPSNVNYLLKNIEDESYANSILITNMCFDLIVIDGRQRNECLANIFDNLSDDGVIVWDNSERSRYAVSYEILTSKGFKRLDFWGMGPIGIEGWCTTVFYRDANCLGI